MHANVRFDLRIVRWYYKIIIKEKPLSNVKNDMGDDIMVLEHLECFLTVARYMNFTKAAKSMFLSQSTLSRNISELENDLGVKLFNRNNRFVKLTTAGDTLLRMAPSLLQEIKKMEERVYASGTDTVGVLHVDMPRIYNAGIFRALNGFVRKYGPAHMRLSPYTRGSLEEVCSNPHAELIGAYSFELPEALDGFESMKLFEDNMVLMVSEYHHFAKRGKIEFSDLQGEHVVLVDRHADGVHKTVISRLFDLGATTSFLTDGVSIELPDIEALLLQVRAGVGIALLPRMIAQAYSSGCELVEIVDFELPYDMMLLWRSDDDSELLADMLARFRKEFPQTEAAEPAK